MLLDITKVFIVLFYIYPPVTRKRRWRVALYFGRIRACLRVVHFRVFRLFVWLLILTT